MSEALSTGQRQGDRTHTILLSVVLIIFVALGAIVLIQYSRPTEDNLPLFTLIVGLIAPTIVGILALLNSQDTKQIALETKEQGVITHNLFNSRMTELIEQTRIAAEAIGMAKGIAQQQGVEADQKMATATAAAALLETAREKATGREPRQGEPSPSDESAPSELTVSIAGQPKQEATGRKTPNKDPSELTVSITGQQK